MNNRAYAFINYTNNGHVPPKPRKSPFPFKYRNNAWELLITLIIFTIIEFFVYTCFVICF